MREWSMQLLNRHADFLRRVGVVDGVAEVASEAFEAHQRFASMVAESRRESQGARSPSSGCSRIGFKVAYNPLDVGVVNAFSLLIDEKKLERSCRHDRAASVRVDAHGAACTRGGQRSISFELFVVDVGGHVQAVACENVCRRRVANGERWVARERRVACLPSGTSIGGGGTLETLSRRDAGRSRFVM